MSGTPPSGRLTFASQAWRERFAGCGWNDFQALWALEAETVEPGNVRRGGWSSVVRIDAADGVGLYLKRQENHDFRDWRRGLRRMPTVVREWQTGVAFRALGIGTAEPVCLGVDQSRSSRGLLVTVALDDYRPLPEVLRDPGLGEADRRVLWRDLARVFRGFHDQGYRHNCLYGHHVLVRREPVGGSSGESWQFALIDLEKAVRTRQSRRAVIADLSAFDRHTDDMSQRDRHWFWDAYFQNVPLQTRRRVLMSLARRSSVRGVDQYIRDCAAGRRGDGLC